MRGEYFKNLPLIEYNDRQMRNILLRAVLASDVLMRSSSFYPYVVKDGETPATIAHDYYRSVAYDWVVLLSNGIVDPYHEWPLSQHDLDALVNKVHGSVQSAQAKILMYRRDGQKFPYMTPTTWREASPAEREGFRPVTVYEYEVERNESKRRIRLLNDALLPVIERQVQTVFTQPRRASRLRRAEPERV